MTAAYSTTASLLETKEGGEASSNTSISSSSLEDAWKEKTRKLLNEIPIGKFTEATWTEAKSALDHWIGKEDLPLCWDMLDRLVDEQLHAPLSSHKFRLEPKHHLNPIMKLWSDNLLQYHEQESKHLDLHLGRTKLTKKPMLPSEVADRMKQCHRSMLLRLTRGTYSILFEASNRSQRFLPEAEGAAFIDKEAREWFETYSE